MSADQVLAVIADQSLRALATYRADDRLIQEHANGERRISQGGYGDRQIYELVQNAADELRTQAGGEIAVVLTETHLYCANQGTPITPEGVDTILHMGVSRKRGGQIGRFGVGVKSVLAICDTPEFFSRIEGIAIGFGFDRGWAREQILAVYPDAGETPVLRMAMELDAVKERTEDAVLDELLQWATTVVRLPLRPEALERLAKDLRDFPAEFPLFSPHVGTVALENRRGARTLRRELNQRRRGHNATIQESKFSGEDVSFDWRIFTREHTPTSEALTSAGELHDRPKIDITWAVPTVARERGMFWAYFPTKFATTLRGILNAPWKTSEDRQAIFDGNSFNDELLAEAAHLVVESLPSLAEQDDPAAYLDYVPARGREAPQFADERLTKNVWKVAAVSPSLVDQDGRFRRPDEIHVHPENLAPGWLDWWSACSGRPADWLHRSAEKRERRARVGYILDGADRQPAGVREWLEALVVVAGAEGSAVAIRIVAAMVDICHPQADEALGAPVVLTTNGTHVPAARGEVFRRGGTGALADDLTYVADEVLEFFAVSGALDILGVHLADARGRFAGVVGKGFAGYNEERWADFWMLSREVGIEDAASAILQQEPSALQVLRARTIAGQWRPLAETLLPGRVVPGDGSRDAGVAVDPALHAADRELFERLGALDAPAGARSPKTEKWFGSEYMDFVWRTRIDTLDETDRRPQFATMVANGADCPGPLGILQELSEEGRAAYADALPPFGLTMRWNSQVGKQTSTSTPVDSPFVWAMLEWGRLHTSRGIRPAMWAVGPGLGAHSDVLPVAQCSGTLAASLELPAGPEEVPSSLWAELLREAERSEDDHFIGALYALVAEVDAHWPESVNTRCRVGDEWSTTVPDEKIVVASDRAEFDLLVQELVPVILAPSSEAAARMIDTWQMRAPSAVISREIRVVPVGEPVVLLDAFPHLRTVVGSQVPGWQLVRCSSIEQITRGPNGIQSVPANSGVKEHQVYVLQGDDDFTVLTAVNHGLVLELTAEECRRVLDLGRSSRHNDIRKAVRSASTLEDQILTLIGEEELRRGLPPGLVESEPPQNGGVPGPRLARLALDAYGDGVLREYFKPIAAKHGDAPASFSGTTSARRWVADLQLPESLAGTASTSPPAAEEISGPIEYPRLHDYQERVVASMAALLREPIPQRAMLSLPTGAGKTRVAVEAVIRTAVDKGFDGPILWIAERNELCEQAVESWKFVWSKVGPAGRLTINRFWGPNDATPVTNNLQLVVATDAKLENHLNTPDFAWLREAALVIVDEAHRGITPRYTRILDQLGLTHHRTDRHLIGLTATPFRGTNEDETRRLVQRFGSRRLDEGLFPGEDAYGALQDQGVLARVEHIELAGVTVTLTASERNDFERRTVPSSVEERLALDSVRNDELLRAIKDLDDSWPILVFAASVNHAKLLAAKLNGLGISAASVDSQTLPGERRSVIERYRRKEIRVLTNYNVLSQGFDAPATRAVVIARPTYSPNVYQQMIGRALRGPLNGGSESCVILDVRDNIENFDGFAFKEYEHLWQAAATAQ